MTMLTRWHDDQSRPTLKEAGRDLAVRVLAPIVVWWLVVLAIGWALTDGPLKDLGTVRGAAQQVAGLVADLAPQQHHAVLLLDRRDGQHHRGLPGRGGARLVAHPAVVVRRRAR